MPPVYSTQFINLSTTAGAAGSFLVPTGYVASVRFLSLWNGMSGASNILVFCASHSAVMFDQPVPAGQSVGIAGMWVVNEGDTITVNGPANYRALISGFLLSNT